MRENGFKNKMEKSRRLTGNKPGAHPVTVYYGYHSIGEFKSSRRLEGPFRVIVFCLLAILLPCSLLIAPLYIRYEVFKDVPYPLGESDLVTVDQPISTFWCSGQELKMNATFHAYLLDEEPKISEDLKQIEMKKHMQLADDTLEYWGFFLLQGSKVTLSVCSRFDGARLMVVKGAKNLKHCALIDASRNNDQIDPWEEDVSAQNGEKIEVTFQQGEDHAQRHQPQRNKDAHSKTSTNPTRNLTSTGDLQKEMAETTNSSLFRPALKLRRKKSASAFISTRDRDEKTEDETARVQNSTSNTDLPIHKHRLLVKNMRTRKFIMTEDEYYDDGDENEKAELNESDFGPAQDSPPNPVGLPPSRLTVENQAQNDAPEILGEDDEVIDQEDIRSSGSSFAKNLWSCYGGDTLFTQTFAASTRCLSQDAMMKHVRMKMVHEVTSTGYYYYIFYSDNDIVSNDIFARFNIEKVEYSFPNYTNSCINSTYCSMPLGFFSSEKVLLEVPLQDGVSDEDALDQMVLISTCRPRLAVYLFFPVAILFSILACAFI